MSMNSYKVRDVLKLNWTTDSKESDGQIRNFYAGKYVFLTGCTGFYGTLILEKLLRTCSEMAGLYIMTREKKGLSIQERMEKLFKKEVFDRLRDTNPNFMDKLIPIYGDLYKPDLGLSAEHRQLLVNNVNVIIHNASVVYFNEKVSLLLRTNVLGTLKMLELAAECPKLNTFVYVSTAYSHHYENLVTEETRPPPCGLKMIEDMIRADEENAAGLSEEAVKDIVGKWINQYAFSKAVAEGVVEDFARRRSLPCIIYRPSIIVSTNHEPFPGWVDTKNGPITLLLMAALGLLHTALVGSHVVMDFVPIDMATNGLLAAIWDYSVNRKTNALQVYNYGSSDWNPVNMYDHHPTFLRAMRNCPSSKIIWYPFVIFTENYYVFYLLHVLLHMFPAILADIVLMVQGKKPKALKTAWKVTKHFRTFQYFINQSWIIKTDKLKSVISRMNATDLEEFSFDMKKIDWVASINISALTGREIVKDPIETLPYAKKKLRNLKILHYTVSTLFFMLVIFFLFRTMSNLFCY